jgi:hypothetical protein
MDLCMCIVLARRLQLMGVRHFRHCDLGTSALVHQLVGFVPVTSNCGKLLRECIGKLLQHSQTLHRLDY